MIYSEIYSFEDLYPQISNDDGWGIDIRHVYILYNILLSPVGGIKLIKDL